MATGLSCGVHWNDPSGGFFRRIFAFLWTTIVWQGKLFTGLQICVWNADGRFQKPVAGYPTSCTGVEWLVIAQLLQSMPRCLMQRIASGNFLNKEEDWFLLHCPIASVLHLLPKCTTVFVDRLPKSLPAATGLGWFRYLVQEGFSEIQNHRKDCSTQTASLIKG